MLDQLIEKAEAIKKEPRTHSGADRLGENK